MRSRFDGFKQFHANGTDSDLLDNSSTQSNRLLGHQRSLVSDPLRRNSHFHASSPADTMDSINDSRRSRLRDTSLFGSQLASLNLEPLAPSPGVQVAISDFIGNSIPMAYRIGDLNNFSFGWNDSVNSSDVNDYYSFSLTNAATVNLSLTGLGADADLYLFNSSGIEITRSWNGGSTNESISRYLVAGTYYVRVNSYAGANTSYSLSASGTGPAADPGSNLFSARDLGNMTRSGRYWNDGVSSSDPFDYFRIDLSENGTLNLSLSNLTADADLYLLDRNGTEITRSWNGGTTSESISRFLTMGTYYVRVNSFAGANTGYRLNLNTTIPSHYGTRTLTGTLGADTFDFTGNYAHTVVLANGNVDYGTGQRDVLDLSNILSTSVTFDLASLASGGVIYNPGNVAQVFDAIRFSDGRDILFEGIETIRFADTTINLTVAPNDPLFNQQWNLHMMGVHDAWRFTTGSNNVLIGVQDTGLGTDPNGSIHYDLRTTTVYTNNYRDDYFRVFTNQQRTNSHGTDVQGIIAANSNNGIGMSGINWNSRVFAIDVLDGNDNDQSLADATQNMINEANANGQRLVINMSLGGGGIDPAFRNLIANNQSNALFVIASGNGDVGTISDPASLASQYSNVIAVGASWGRTDADGNTRTPGDRISYPGWWGSNYGTGLTLMGPSEVIATSATRNLNTGAISFGFDTGFNGTSAATPNVAGVASLVWSAYNSLSAVQVQQILAQTAVDLGAAGYDTTTGNGFVNASAAVRRAMAMARGAA